MVGNRRFMNNLRRHLHLGDFPFVPLAAGSPQVIGSNAEIFGRSDIGVSLSWDQVAPESRSPLSGFYHKIFRAGYK